VKELDDSGTVLSAHFDVVIINLEEEEVRRTSALNEVKKLDLNPNFLFAQNASDSDHRDNLFLRGGASACFASHVDAWKSAALSTKPFTLILEDDVKFEDIDKLKESLELVIIHSIDIAQLGFLFTGFRQLLDVKLHNIEISIMRLVNTISRNHFDSRLRVSRNLSIPRKFIADDFRAGAHCYVVSRSAAQRLISINPPFMITLDGFLMALSWHQAFKSIRTRRSFATQYDFPSRIKSS
jgi:GR25 family glycosyltransferase involved in LPS biosynthesis